MLQMMTTTWTGPLAFVPKHPLSRDMFEKPKMNATGEGIEEVQ